MRDAWNAPEGVPTGWRPAPGIGGMGPRSGDTPGPTKRRALLTCAAANDDEDLGSLFNLRAAADKRPRKDRQTVKADCATADSAAVELEASESACSVAKKEKEFAWMDSEDEEERGSGEQDDGKHNADSKPCEGSRDGGDEEHSLENAEVTAKMLDGVSSFGRMMMLAPSLQRWLRGGRRNPEDIMAACRALERTRFFDGDILEELYSVLRRMLRNDKLDAAQTNDAIQCLKTLNAYDKGVFSAVAKSFKTKTGTMEATMRNIWLEVFKGFGHDVEKDFLQVLEVPPVPTTSPSYRKVRCWHHSRGTCVLDAACTFSHDHRAPLSLADGGKEDTWRCKTTVMTQNQKTMGCGEYGLGPLRTKGLT